MKRIRQKLSARIRMTSLMVAGSLLLVSPADAETFYYQLVLAAAGSGDPDGEAHGTLSIDDETGRVSWGLYYSGIAAPTAMHVHRGAAGESGGVILALNLESKLGEGALTGRVLAEPEIVREILANPAGFFVNIHNGEFRGGALRAQLGNEWEMVR